MDCPVCPRRELPATSVSCPNCGTDLTLLRRVEALYDGLDGLPAPAPAERSRKLVGVLVFLLLASSIAAAVYFSRARAEVDTLRRQIAAGAAGERADPAAAARPSPISPEARRALVSRLKEVESLAVGESDNEIRLSFRVAAFNRGSEELLPSARQVLSRVAATLRSEAMPVTITLRGYTDETPVVSGGRWPDNWTLGLSRASSAARHLKKQWGETPFHIEVASASGSVPAGAASLAEAASRSVDLVFCLSCEPAER